MDTLSQLVGGILNGSIRVVDLTIPLEPATPTIQLPPQFAPSKPFSLEEISRYDSRGPAWYWNNISCGEHTGTHFDAPIHWVTGKDYPQNATHNIPVERFIGPACVINVAQQVRENADFLLTTDVIEACRSRCIPEYRGRRPAHARFSPGLRPVPGARARHSRRGSRNRRDRRGPGRHLQSH